MTTIKANKLRIGSWIFDETLNDFFQIEELSKYVGYELWAVYSSEIQRFKCKEVCPVLITPENIVKCGFVLTKHFSYEEYELDFDVDNKTHTLSVSFPRNESVDVIVYYDKIYYKHIKHIHQLQNLFESLSDKELQVNLK